MRSALVLLLLTTFYTTQAQNFDYKRDFETLLAQSKDAKSPYYYPTLLKRFNRADTTLTNKEVLALQIGYTSDPNYKPYQTLDTEREISRLIRDKNYPEALNLCNSFLKMNPVSFVALMEKGFAYMKLKKDSIAFHRDKLLLIYKSIEWSGDGSKEHPFFVLGPRDGQLVIRYIWNNQIGTMGSDRDANDYFLDVLEMKLKDEPPVTLYFNVNHAANKMFTPEQKKEMNNAVKEALEKEKSEKKH